MKIHIVLFCLSTCITLNAAQMARILTQEQEKAAQTMFQLIYENKIDDLKALLLKYPEIINEIPTVNFTFETENSNGTKGWGENVKSAIHYAIEAANHEALCILLEHNANPNIQNSDGNTPLIWTAIHQNSHCFESIKTLIEAGANKEIKNNRQATALDIANGGDSFLNYLAHVTAMQKYHQAIAAGEAERDRYAREKPQALQEITDAMNLIDMKDLAPIIHGYAYGVLPRDLPKSNKKESWLTSHCAIQ